MPHLNSDCFITLLSFLLVLIVGLLHRSGCQADFAMAGFDAPNPQNPDFTLYSGKSWKEVRNICETLRV